MERIEDVLKKKGDNAFIGSLEGKASAADYLAWPWLERLEAVATFNASKLNVLHMYCWAHARNEITINIDRKSLLKSQTVILLLGWVEILFKK